MYSNTVDTPRGPLGDAWLPLSVTGLKIDRSCGGIVTLTAADEVASQAKAHFIKDVIIFAALISGAEENLTDKNETQQTKLFHITFSHCR